MANSLSEALRASRTLIMGVVNTTPDSFSDGGKFLASDAAVDHALSLCEQGADILDIGGESTRPGAQPVGVQEELDRVLPVIEALSSASDVPLSIDTSKPEVMQVAVQAGASLINDVNGLRAEGALEVAAESGAKVCVMHMQGEPRTMQKSPHYEDVLADVIAFLAGRIDDCLEYGIERQNIIVDPGIGFGKTLQHNLTLLNGVARMRSELNCELLIGVSRKSMIDAILGRPVDQRMAGSVGLAVQAALNGAKILRVHDVAETHDAIRCAEAVASI